MKTAVIIPAYNEERTVREVAEKAGKYVDKVIVVDDGSTDNTANEAMKTPAEVIVHQKNLGKAHAMKSGIWACEGVDIIIFIDGDLQHDPSEIPALITCIEEGNDLCIGSRFYNDNDSKNMPTANCISNKIVSFILSILTGRKITDPQSGFRAIKKRKLDDLKLDAVGYSIEHIMILEAVRKKFTIKEVPISCVYGEETSSIKPLKDTFQITYQIAKFVLKGAGKGAR